jgi:hypothetical protein
VFDELPDSGLLFRSERAYGSSAYYHTKERLDLCDQISGRRLMTSKILCHLARLGLSGASSGCVVVEKL